MVTTQRQEEAPPVLLGGNPRNQNPLKLLEVLLKGFCPTIIVDRVDVNDDDDDHHRHDDDGPIRVVAFSSSSSSSSKRKISNKIPASSATATATAARPQHHRRHHHQHKRGRAHANFEGGHGSNKKPFEIAERPPSDVIGITKKMWEGFCYDQRAIHPTAAAPPLKKKIGFCSILTDHMGCSSASDDDSLSCPPDGEECSVGTYSDSSASGAAAGCGVDLSPQSSPRGGLTNDLTRQQQSSADHDQEEVVSSSIIYVDNESYYEEDEEDLCLVEFQDRRTYRGTQVLLMTLLALYATLSLLRATGNTGIQFALENKRIIRNSHHNTIARPIITFAISSR